MGTSAVCSVLILFCLYFISCYGDEDDSFLEKMENENQSENNEKNTYEDPSIRNFEKNPKFQLLSAPHVRCGTSHLQDRIVGGSDASLGQFPWIARLGYNISGKIMFICSGSLINSNYILTAGHCTVPAVDAVILGDHDTSKEIDCDKDVCAPSVQKIEPLKSIPHPRYRLTIHDYDIGLVKLAWPAQINQWVSPICLPPGYNALPKSGQTQVVGWGLLRGFSRTVPRILQVLSLPIFTYEQCVKQFPEYTRVGSFCAGGLKGQDSCNGDSGSPLMKVSDINGNAQTFAVGVVSNGVEECDGSYPGIYTNVSYYMDWILETIKPLEK